VLVAVREVDCGLSSYIYICFGLFPDACICSDFVVLSDSMINS